MNRIFDIICSVYVRIYFTTVQQFTQKSLNKTARFPSLVQCCSFQWRFTVIVLKQMMNQIGVTKSVHSLPFFFRSSMLGFFIMVEQKFYGVYVHLTRANAANDKTSQW